MTGQPGRYRARVTRVAIVLCGDLDRQISSQYAPYETLYADFLHLGTTNDLELETFRAHEGDLPKDIGSFDAMIIGGSPAGVYEPHEWIPPLLSTIRESLQLQVATWGICFGHQAIAAALGAEVSKSPRGWNLAVREYEFCGSRAPRSADQLRLIAFHQDQVRSVPEGTSCYLTSPGCEIAGLVGDNLMTMQPHPEFTPHITSELLEASRGSRISESEIDDALTRLDGPLSSEIASELFWSSVRAAL